MRTIISSVPLVIEGVKVVPVSSLPPYRRVWVKERQNDLQRRATLPEKVSSQILSLFEERPSRQAYFSIRGRSYFLDFFFPSRMLAIEIDGSSHTSRKDYDRRRDADFRSIGIRTVRIKNKDVMEGRLVERLYNRHI